MTTIKQIKQRSDNDTSNTNNISSNKLSKVVNEKSIIETDANTGSYVGPIIDLLKHHDKNKNITTSPSTTTNKKHVDKDKNKKIKGMVKKGSKSNWYNIIYSSRPVKNKINDETALVCAAKNENVSIP